MNTQDRGLRAVFHSRFRHGLASDKLITVCDACLCAACWHGEWLCERSRSAGTVKKTVADLEELHREHPDQWRRQALVHGDISQAEFDADHRKRRAAAL